MHSCKDLYLSLQAQATESVRPWAHSANSAGCQIKASLIRARTTFDYWITFLQRACLGGFQEGLLLPSREGIHTGQVVCTERENPVETEHYD